MVDWKEATVELQKKLDPSHVKPPPQGKFGSYIEGWHAIAEANRIFGHDGWSYNVDKLQLTNATSEEVQKDGRNGPYTEVQHRVGYMAIVTVTVDGVSRGDVGHGQGFGKSEGDAHDSAVKEAVTDALKRALRTFGNPFGLALYDKSGANVGREVPEGVLNDITNAETLSDLQAVWTENREWQGDPVFAAAKDQRKAQLMKDAA